MDNDVIIVLELQTTSKTLLKTICTLGRDSKHFLNNKADHFLIQRCMTRQKEVLNLSFADLNADPHVALADLNVDPHVADGPPDILTQVTFWVGRVVLIDGVAPL